MSEDVLCMDGTVEVAISCYMKMPKCDYEIMMALSAMTAEEKQKLLHKSIPRITRNRVAPPCKFSAKADFAKTKSFSER